jgi:hypothetical protein
MFKIKSVRYENRIVHICTTRYDKECPEDTGYTKELKNERIKDGWSSRVI